MISEHHYFNIPKLDPYKLLNAWEFHALNPSAPLNFIGRNTNVSIFGLENAKINQIKYINWITISLNNYTIMITIFVCLFFFQQRLWVQSKYEELWNRLFCAGYNFNRNIGHNSKIITNWFARVWIHWNKNR